MAMMQGQLGEESLKDWNERLTGDIVKSFEEVVSSVLALPTPL